MRQQGLETEGAVNLVIKGVQDTISADLQKIIVGVAPTDAKVTEFKAESERALKLVSAESGKFAAKVAADKMEMDSRAETFRLAGVNLEAQLSEGLSKIKAAQAAADATSLMQSESTRATLAKILEHEAEMRELNKRNIALIEAKFAEIDAARVTATKRRRECRPTRCSGATTGKATVSDASTPARLSAARGLSLSRLEAEPPYMRATEVTRRRWGFATQKTWK